MFRVYRKPLSGILQGIPLLKAVIKRQMLLTYLLTTAAERYFKASLRMSFPDRLKLILL